MSNKFRSGVLFGFAVSLAASACGGDASDNEPFTNGTGGIGVGGNGGNGGNGDLPGNGGSANGGAPGAGGAPPLSCSGTFGASRELYVPTPGYSLASPTVSPDELELFYTTSDSVPMGATFQWHFRHSVRASKSAPFPEGAPMPELDAGCPDPTSSRNMDLSPNGLTAYFVCYTEGQEPIQGPLRIARRSALGAVFALDPTAYGTVGPSPSISADELVVYTSALTRPGPPLMYTRATVTAQFGPGTPVPGLATVDISTLDPSPDGLSLYGTLNGGIAVATRPSKDAPFGTPTPVIASMVSTDVFGSEDLSPNCRSLYFIYVNNAQNPTTFSIRVADR